MAKLNDKQYQKRILMCVFTVYHNCLRILFYKLICQYYIECVIYQKFKRRDTLIKCLFVCTSSVVKMLLPKHTFACGVHCYKPSIFDDFWEVL